MGRRSRKRSTGTAASRERPDRAPQAPAPHAPPRAATHRARLDEAPKPAWAPFPLTELATLVGIVLLVAGFVSSGTRRGPMLLGGMLIVTLAAGELAVREHFSGYRSHSSLLAGICAVLVAVPLWLSPVPQEAILAAGVVVFAVAFVLLRRAFARRSGGVGFRV